MAPDQPIPTDIDPKAAENARLAQMYGLFQKNTRESIIKQLQDAGVEHDPRALKSELVAQLHDAQFPPQPNEVPVTKVTRSVPKLPGLAAAMMAGGGAPVAAPGVAPVGVGPIGAGPAPIGAIAGGPDGAPTDAEKYAQLAMAMKRPGVALAGRRF
jgi:hypothetical protein